MTTDYSRAGSCWTEAIIPTSHFRIAAGVCALALGLFIGCAGAVANADADSGGSPSPSEGKAGASQGAASANGLSGGPAANQAKTDTGLQTAQGTTAPEPGATGTTGGSDELNSTFSTDTTTAPEDEAESSDSSTLTSELDEAVSDLEEAVSDVTALVTDPTGTTPQTGTPAPASTTPASNSVPAPANTTAPSPPAAPTAYSTPQVWKAFEPVTNAVATVGRAMGSVPGTLAALGTSPTPIADAITSVQEMLSSVTGAVIPIASVPANLYALMGTIPPPVQPPLIGGGFAPGRGTLPGADVGLLFGPQAWQTPQVAPSGSSLFGTMAPRPALGTIVSSGLNQPLSVAGTAPLAPEAVSPPAERSFLEHVVSAVLVPASLTALAALALPGVAGLLIIGAAGIRLGYRQAKAALAVRASGIARFAGPGPLGVVRSGSMIALRQRARGPRTARAVCPEASRTVRTPEKVA